jgi:hypothetical protein
MCMLKYILENNNWYLKLYFEWADGYFYVFVVNFELLEISTQQIIKICEIFCKIQ